MLTCVARCIWRVIPSYSTIISDDDSASRNLGKWPPSRGNQTKKTLPGTNSSPLPLDPWEDDFPFPYQVGCDGSQEGVPDFAFTMTYFLGYF